MNRLYIIKQNIFNDSIKIIKFYMIKKLIYMNPISNCKKVNMYIN